MLFRAATYPISLIHLQKLLLLQNQRTLINMKHLLIFLTIYIITSAPLYLKSCCALATVGLFLFLIICSLTTQFKTSQTSH